MQLGEALKGSRGTFVFVGGPNAVTADVIEAGDDYVLVATVATERDSARRLRINLANVAYVREGRLAEEE